MSDSREKKKIVFSTGAGVSAESGLSTFRDAGGLWEQYPVMQVASAEGFAADPALVHKFYNARRRDLVSKEPNEAHRLIADLQRDFDVRVITQNVDDLHERAGSREVLHLHGELMKLRDVADPGYIETLSAPDLESSPDTLSRDGKGRHMRPHIVFFGEAVPNIELAMELVEQADVFVVIGTSLNVYPAAGLLAYVRSGVPVYYIDPSPADVKGLRDVTVIRKKATEGMAELAAILRNNQ